MKRIKRLFSITIAAMIAVVPLCMAAVSVKVKNPGTLEKQLPLKKIHDGEDLEINGRLNNDDLRYLRYLCGCDTALGKSGRYLGRIDMSKVSFELSGAPFIILSNGKTYGITSSHTLPPAIFASCYLDEVVLPERLDSIGDFAFNSSAIKRLRVPDVEKGKYIIYGDTLLTELEWNGGSQGFQLDEQNLIGLKKVVVNDIDYLPGGFAMKLPLLEEIEINGPLLHFDGTFAIDCPKLKRITFNGPVMTSTNGLASSCPELREVVFNGPFMDFPLFLTSECPEFQGVRMNAPVFNSNDSTVIADSARYMEWPGIREYISHNIRVCEKYNNNQSGFMSSISMDCLSRIKNMALAMNMMKEAAICDSLCVEMKQLDACMTKLDILKKSPSYRRGEVPENDFRYAEREDSLLTLTRERFNLDSIAGCGSDIEKMKNLLYWVHDLIKHDGSSSWPDCPLNLRDMYDICQRDNRGVNCRMLAMCLTEALLAEDIPARYVTCQSKDWANDYDCHVICVAWSDSLGKWVWLDPTFAAYLTDDKGMLLHPGEVRYRLQNDMPVVLNEDANWNHESTETPEHYLDYYMAKNLYILSSNSLNQAEPEGKSEHEQGYAIALVPEGSDYTNAKVIINDDEWFWQSPRK